MGSFIMTIIIGLIVGAIAKFIAPFKNEPSGLIMTALVGIVGALLATYVGQAIGWYNAAEGAGWIASIIGAIVVLGVYATLAKGRTSA
jgi:uncharacterized membrane protein YeaQ/YmgE (transglycosylase-associated protein family)